MANTFADKILVETDAQRRYYEKELGVRAGKCVSIFIGVDEESFFYDSGVKKNEEFTVFFRGRLTIEAGFKYIIEAARLLEHEPIIFKAVGFGFGPVVTDIKERLERYKLKNFTLAEQQMPIDALQSAMVASHVSLGQFEDNERLSRTIPHKAFESLAMRLPYITARASEDSGITELFTDDENCLFVKPADPADLAEKIKILARDPQLRARLAENGFGTYQSRVTSRILGGEVLAIARELANAKK
jgi:glycosyltransferase involved in cell wall biosynthesis